MNKKFLGALLLGSLVMGGTFVSCTDYDDDIDNLQGQIDKLAGKAELESQVSSLSSQISAAQTAATAAQTAASAAQAAADAAKSVAENKLDEAAVKAIAEAAAEGAAAAAKEGKDAAAVAQAAAEAAQAAADAAQATADKGVSAAEAAQAAADAASKAAGEVASALAASETALRAEINAAVKVAEAAEKAAKDAEKAALQAAQDGKDAAAIAEAAAGAAQKTADEAQKAADKVAEDLAKLEERVKTLEEKLANVLTNEDLTSIKEDLSQLTADANKYLAVYTAVTSVDFYFSDHVADDIHDDFFLTRCDYRNHWISFVKATEKDNVFTAPDGNYFTFTKGNTTTYGDSKLIRVSPANAEITKDQIKLINSKGEVLPYVKVEKVERFNDVLVGNTRADAGVSGLWVVTFKLEENVSDEDLAKYTSYKVNGEDRDVLFAISINNTAEAEEREIVSGFDLAVKKPAEANIATTQMYIGNNGKIESIWSIHNRYEATEHADNTLKVKELEWLDNSAPAVAPILEGTNVNAGDRINGYDNRQYSSILSVVAGEEINIWIDTDSKGNVNNEIKGFYVTLDTDFALESVPSEINAWNSYSYENLGVLQAGNKGTITINNANNVNGDIIGFRVYAVNLDGTLLDPDGRAFYVVVGKDIVRETIEGVVNVYQGGSSRAESDFIDVEGKFVNTTNAYWWYDTQENPKFNWNGNTTDVYLDNFDVLYFDKDKNPISSPRNKNIKYVKFVLNNAANFVDNATYTQTVKLTNATYNWNGSNDIGWSYTSWNYEQDVKAITFKMTKKLPTVFPANFSPKTNQIVNGVYKCFLNPNVEAANSATYGYMDMDNVFNNLDPYYKFTFGTSVKNAQNQDDDNVVLYGYELNVAKSYVDGVSQHATSVAYTYSGVSTYKDERGVWHYGKDVTITGYQFQTIYACVFDKSVHSWSWATGATTSINYQATGKSVDITKIAGKNTYMNSRYGITLSEAISNGWLKISSAKLTSNSNGLEEYFDCQIASDGVTINFVSQSGTTNPTANVASTLTIVCKDWYGHNVEIAVPYTVNKI